MVDERVYDEFVDAMVKYVDAIDVGSGLDDPDIGPPVSENELESTLDYVEIGKEEGAALETGGNRLADGEYADGYYVRPAVFSDVNTDVRIAQEETFGPVLSVIEADDFEDALELANDVRYELSASIVFDRLVVFRSLTAGGFINLHIYFGVNAVSSRRG